MNDDERDYDEETYNRNILETGDGEIDEPLILWHDDSSYAAWQAYDGGPDPEAAVTSPDVTSPWPAIDYGEPPF